ncbi:MAG TPA: hypothetical protein VNJ04_05375 [Gemmatimonadaceae bacterium]|nr:hypothetical protein [Gemmatimonadaceae bacterium]
MGAGRVSPPYRASDVIRWCCYCQRYRLRPRFIGFSCALPQAVAAANALVGTLKAALEPDLHCRYVLSAFAFRLGESAEPPKVSHGAEVILDLELFAKILARR